MSRSRLTFATAAAVAMAVMAGCGPRANPAAPTPRPASTTEVRSSIRDGVELTQPVSWQAYVMGIGAGDVAAVRFLIDGKLRHLARTAPYLFAGRGNLLLPGTLGPGSHIFAVDVTLTNGHHLTTATVAVVSAAASGIPRQVLGSWIRTVTAAEVIRTPNLRPGGRDLAADRNLAGADRRRRRGPLHQPNSHPRPDRRPGALRVRRAAGRRQPDTQLPAHIPRRILSRHRRRRDLPMVTPRQCAHHPSRQRPPMRQPQQLLERHLYPIRSTLTPLGHSLAPGSSCTTQEGK